MLDLRVDIEHCPDLSTDLDHSIELDPSVNFEDCPELHTDLDRGLRIDLSVLLEPRPDLGHNSKRLPVYERQRASVRSDGRQASAQGTQQIAGSHSSSLAARSLTGSRDLPEPTLSASFETCPEFPTDLDRGLRIDLSVLLEPRPNLGHAS
jgi:hypothetical protein